MKEQNLKEIAGKIRNLHLKRLITNEQYRAAIDELKALRK